MSVWRGAVARFRANRPAFAGLVIVGALAAFALLGPLLIPWDPNESDFSLARDRFGAPPGPSWSHWLGTDTLFRDELARLAYGGRISLSIALVATLLSTLVGTAVGVTAGLTAGSTPSRLIDEVLMRTVDVLLALPYLLFVTAIGVAVGRADLGTILLLLGLTSWAGTARVVRAKTLLVKELDYVTAARALGAGTMRIVRKHILPNVAGSVLVIATSSVASMILAEAVLSYLTVGVQPPRATWGRMLHEGEGFLGTRFSLVAIPGFAILLAVLAWNRIGEGLRDVLDSRDRVTPKKHLPADFVIAVLAVLLLSVARPKSLRPPPPEAGSSATPVRGGTFRVATFTNLRTIDPALATDEGALSIDDLVYGGLVTWSADGRIVTDLAKEVRLSPDGTTYRFDLRPGLHFHDGTDLRAADIKRSIERTLNPKTSSPAASYYSMIRGFSAYRKGKTTHLDGVRVESDLVVTIELASPDATFLPLVSLPFMAPVCASSGDRADLQHPSPPCGAGPFRVESADPEGVKMTRFEGYYDPEKPYLDRIEWLASIAPRAQRYRFEDGTLDYLRDIGSSDVALFHADPGWSSRTRWSVKKSTTAIFLNTELPPFDNKNIRRAVAFAVDPSVLDKIRPETLAADRVIPPSIPGPDRKASMRRHDLDAAREEMAKAGYPNGYPEEIEYITVGETFEQQAAEVFQQQLAKIGLRIRLRLVTVAEYEAASSRRRTSQMGWAGWSADFPDPSNFFEPILSTAAITDDGSQNKSFYSNTALDAVLERAHSETDRAKRFSLYERCEEMIRDDAPWIPVYYTRSLEIWQPYVKNYAPHEILSQHFQDVWIDRGSP